MPNFQMFIILWVIFDFKIDIQFDELQKKWYDECHVSNSILENHFGFGIPCYFYCVWMQKLWDMCCWIKNLNIWRTNILLYGYGILMGSLPRKASFLKQSNLVILFNEPFYFINVGVWTYIRLLLHWIVHKKWIIMLFLSYVFMIVL